LLLQVKAHSGAAPVDAHRVDIGGLPGKLGNRDRICEVSRSAAAQKARDFELAGLAPKLVPFLDFPDQLELMEAGVEIDAVRTDPAGWSLGQIEKAAAQCPAALVPLGGGTVSVSPAVRGVVEGASIDVRPVEKIQLGIVGVFVGVKDIDYGKFAGGQHQAVFRLRTSEPADVGVHFFGFATEIDDLADKCAVYPRVGIVSALLVGFCAREAGDAVSPREPEAHIDLGNEPEFGALPQSQPRIERRVGDLTRPRDTRQAICAFVGRSECGIPLRTERRLAVEIDDIRVERRRRFYGSRACHVSEAIVQAHTQSLQGEIGIIPLPGVRE